jgi:hypothetical protein
MITDTTYDPTTLVSPALTSTVDPRSAEYRDLNNAFDRAPVFFKNLLCELTGVYLIPRGSTFSPSWGFRDPSNLNNRYIGISQDLWGDNPQTPIAMKFTTYETKVVRGLLTGLNNPPYFENADPDDSKMMLLSVLAHEFGHVLWVDLFINSPGNDPDFSTFCPGTVPDASWQNTSANPIKWARWRNFGDVADTATDVSDPSDPGDASDDPSYQEIKVRTLKQLIQSGKPNNLKKAHKLIVRLLASTKRPWPSLFGAFSTNEDFVETFTLYILTHANPRLNSLEMTVPVQGSKKRIDIPATIRYRPLLLAKLACFDNYFSSTRW